MRELVPLQPSSARTLVIIGLAVGLVSVAMWTLFVAAEIISDPGGIVGWTWIALWFVPTLLLSALTLFWPRIGDVVLIVLLLLYVAGIIAMLVWAEPWYEFEDTHGPVQLVVALALSVPVVLLGRTQPRDAGWMLIVLVMAPLLAGLAAFVGIRVMGGAIAMVVIGMPLLATAVLYLLAQRAATRPQVSQNRT